MFFFYFSRYTFAIIFTWFDSTSILLYIIHIFFCLCYSVFNYWNWILSLSLPLSFSISLSLSLHSPLFPTTALPGYHNHPSNPDYLTWFVYYKVLIFLRRFSWNWKSFVFMLECYFVRSFSIRRLVFKCLNRWKRQMLSFVLNGIWLLKFRVFRLLFDKY